MNLTILISTLALASLIHINGATTPDVSVLNNTPATVAISNLRVNTDNSTMKWNAKKIGGEHYGTIKLAEGTLQVNGNKLMGGDFTIDMTTIVVEDITRPESNKRLTDHLKSDDFFSVEKYGASTFKITKAVPVAKAKGGAPNYTITGDLTIKGITHPVTFPAVVKINNKMAEAAATIEVDRIKYDIKYRSGLVGTAADKIIYDTFTLDIKLIAGASAS